MKLTFRAGMIAALVILFALTAGIFITAYFSLGSLDRSTDEIISRVSQGSAGPSEIAAMQAQKDNDRSAGLLIMIILLAAAGVLTLGTALGFSRNPEKANKNLPAALSGMAAGELTGLIESGAHQLGLAGERLAEAARQSGESSRRITAGSLQIARGTREQSVNTRETARAAGELNNIINQVAAAAGEQSLGIKKAVNEITAVSQTLSQAAMHVDIAAKGAKQAEEITLDVLEKNKQHLAEIEKIKESTAGAARKIEDLESRSREIGNIISVIDDIASQTNLLALNAAIEAARAGEQGSGFAVVSEEVGKLSERTAIATRQITDLVSSVQEDIREAAAMTAGGSQVVSEGYEIIAQSGQSLERIYRVTAGVNLQMEQISSKTRQASAAAGEAVKLMGSIGRISEQTAEATLTMSLAAAKVSSSNEATANIAGQNSTAVEVVSASAQEMSSRSQELELSSRDLKSIAAELAISISGYKTDK
jgi:methyl-accepting chemotaxis protein